MQKFVIFILLVSQTAWADFVFWPLGLVSRLERDEDQKLVTRSALQYAGGIRLNNWSIELSRIELSSKTQEGNVSIEREYQDMTVWLGHHFLLLNKIEFVGFGGLGLYQEKVHTQVSSTTDTSSSEQKPLLGLSGELRWKPYDMGFLLSTGARLIMAENFDPNPQPELFIRAGWQF